MFILSKIQFKRSSFSKALSGNVSNEEIGKTVKEILQNCE